MERKFMQSVLLALLVAAALAFTPAAAANSSKLVSTEWLAQNLGAPGMVIIDVRTAANYEFGHLPGAVSMPYSAWEPYNRETRCQLMPSAADMTVMLRSLGVNRSTHVVVYDQGNTALDATEGGAVVWIMESMGHENVSYLDGGFTKWTFEGRIIDRKKPAPQPGNFIAKLDTTRVATLDDVIANLKEAIFLDDRSAVQHFGNSKRA